MWRLAHPDAPLAQPVARFEVALPPGATLDPDAPAVAWSASGARLAFVACAPDACRLFIRALDDARAQAIAGTEGAAVPFFSPDEAWVGFFADGKLKKVAVAGGTPIALADARQPLGATWLNDGTIVFASALAGGLQRVNEAGGEPRRASDADASEGELRHEQPEAIAGSRAILTTAMLAPDPDVKRLRDRIGAQIRHRIRSALEDRADPAVLRALELAVSGALLQAGMGHLRYADLPRLLEEFTTLIVRNGR